METWWTPEPIWEGQDAYIIGGGPSLRTFNWNLLKGRNTIGCNSAHLLGREVVKVLFFADRKFFEKWKGEIKGWGGKIVTNCEALRLLAPNTPWVLKMRRKLKGLGTGDTLALNGSSGAASTNLALSMGAQRVFLLGMDLKSEPDGRQNWHDRQEVVRIRPETFRRFREGWEQLALNLPVVFPGREVFCLTDTPSMPFFPTVSIGDHFGSGSDVNLRGHAVQGKIA